MCCSLNAGARARAQASFQTHVAASGLARDSVACSSLETAQSLRVGLVHSPLQLPHPQTQILCCPLDECRGSTPFPGNKIKGWSQAEGRHTFIAIVPMDACKPSLCKYSQRPKVSQPNPASKAWLNTLHASCSHHTPLPSPPAPHYRKAAQAAAHSSETHSSFSILGPKCWSSFAHSNK